MRASGIERNPLGRSAAPYQMAAQPRRNLKMADVNPGQGLQLRSLVTAGGAKWITNLPREIVRLD